MYLVVVPFAVDGHMITCDRGQQGSSGVMSGLSTSCQPNHLFIFLTAKLGPALAGGEGQKGKVRGERGGSQVSLITTLSPSFIQPHQNLCRFHEEMSSIQSRFACFDISWLQTNSN